MKALKTRKLWFLVLSIGFSYFTVFNQFTVQSKAHIGNFSEKGIENDEKSNESNHPLFIQELTFELSLATKDGTIKMRRETEFNLSTFWPSPNTPPPDLG